MTSWHSLFLPLADQSAIADTLRETLVSLGYTPFDPFGLIPGKAYPKAVRLFVGPPRENWVRVVAGAFDERLMAPLSALAPCLSLRLDGDESDARFYAEGRETGPEVFSRWLRPGRMASDLEAAPAQPTGPGGPAEALPLDALPDDVKALAGGVDLKQARRLFNRLTGTTARRSGTSDDVAEQAQALIAAGSPPNWNGRGGQRLARLMACLTAPDDWREPDFTTLRDAYQVRARLERRPDADLYPGDAEALAAVPGARAYTPVYAGMTA